MREWFIAATLGGALVGGTPQTNDDDKYSKIEPSAKQMAKLQALTPMSVADGIEVRDDDLETTATLTTINAYQSKGGFTDRVRSDNFLRAFINKRTGDVHYQVYQSISYNYIYRNFTAVSYATSEGPQVGQVFEIEHEIVTCAGGPSMCSYKDTLGFDVTDKQLRWVASQYVPGGSPFWRFKFRSQAGGDWEDRLAPAEAAGLLEAVARYRSKHNLSAPNP